MNAPLPNKKQITAKVISANFAEDFLRRRVLMSLFLLIAAILLYIGASAQGITEIITDYGGYWKSNKSTLNPIKPDNSHNLLSFNYNGGRYSTGANDALLTAHGDKFVPGDYRALPVHSIAGAITSNTKIGLGAMYDGVYNGASATKPVNDMAKYLNDGLHGLDLGTCVANIPAGQIMFAVTNLRMNLVGDNIPDLLVTQVADPATNGLDRYEFVDINGNTVGNYLDIVIANLHFLGNWTADFYEASSNPMTLASGFTQTDRPLRVWAADFSDFGINASNIGQVAYFRMKLNGNSDISFVAYNNSAFQIGSVLPTKLNYFKASGAQEKVTLNWQTVSEQQMDKFVIESSYDGQSFFTMDSVKAAGFSNTAKNYSYTQRNPRNGKIYYRLKQVDQNGAYEYSSITMVNSVNDTYSALSVYPNPVANTLTVRHQLATGQEQCTIHNMQGVVMAQKTLKAGTIQSSFDVQNLAAGAYMVVVSNGKEKYTEMLLKK